MYSRVMYSSGEKMREEVRRREVRRGEVRIEGNSENLLLTKEHQ